MNFLVTGGAGFIGSHIVERLLKEGHFVRVLDNLSTGKIENLSFIKSISAKNQYELISGDIRDETICDKAAKGIDYVLHHAALCSVSKSLIEPENYNEVNINGTLFMLEAARKHKIKKFVFASSSSIYGDVDKFPEKEDFLPLLISPYALSKLTGEYYCSIFAKIFKLETISLRYFNVFGPRQALDDEYAVVIPKFIQCILNSQPPPIFGSGIQSRDFTFVSNVVDANFLAIKAKGIENAVFNVASGEDNTILQLVDYLNKIIGKRIKPKFLAVRKGDVLRTLADISKIKKMLNFKPKINFEEGLEITVDWFRSMNAAK